jgi:hypothetical protein
VLVGVTGNDDEAVGDVVSVPVGGGVIVGDADPVGGSEAVLDRDVDTLGVSVGGLQSM